jgi:hypothetical protein
MSPIAVATLFCLLAVATLAHTEKTVLRKKGAKVQWAKKRRTRT